MRLLPLGLCMVSGKTINIKRKDSIILCVDWTGRMQSTVINKLAFMEITQVVLESTPRRFHLELFIAFNALYEEFVYIFI